MSEIFLGQFGAKEAAILNPVSLVAHREQIGSAPAGKGLRDDRVLL